MVTFAKAKFKYVTGIWSHCEEKIFKLMLNGAQHKVQNWTKWNRDLKIALGQKVTNVCNIRCGNSCCDI